ncbi:Smr/MutS family protein [Patescibacteria group bacterium]|jgi:DNA mismatch repair protein MutS2|nr:Smr/MutS family protein [Patescibacteria group bacterium]
MKRSPEQELVDAALFGAELGSGVPEIDLHGLSVHEALRELDTFIYQRYYAGTALRIIHGRGSQKLRNAVHDWLKKHPKDIAGYRDSRNPSEAGGVTVAVLR